jgi:5-hydroxyisourate hydrolase-like protein (transthyretin family)
MDRPKQRRLILLGLVLLACGALLLLGRQWTSVPDPVPVRPTIATRQLVEPQPDKVEPPTIEAAAPNVAPPSAPSSPTPTGFRGHIIDAVTRQPVKEFEVQLIHVRRDAYTEDEPITRNFKSATGRFTWTDVAAGTWRAAVSASGYQMFNVGEFQISEGERTRETVMPLLRGFAVRGRVFDSSTGAGIVDAWISFRQVNDAESFGKSKANAKSKEDGSFTLDGIPGGNITLIVAARDHAYRELSVVVDEKTPPQEITLSSGATIAGTVTTTSGVGVKGRVYLNGPGPGYSGETNETGKFSFNHMPAGNYRVSADTSAGSAMQEFVLGQDENKEGISLIVGAGRSIRGTVRGLPPAQLQKAHILLRRESDVAVFSARPDERGSYALHGVPPGHAVINVFGTSLQFAKQVDVPADQDIALDIVFPTGARLSGRVTQGGKPAANRKVWMVPVENKSDVLYRASTSEDGQYEIEALPPGDYRLRADEDISRSITMAGDAVLDIDIPVAQLSARIVEQGSAVPIVGANVYVRGSAPETARVRGDKQTDDFGQVTLTGIEPGEIVLEVYKPGYEMHREKIAYSSPITDKTITLPRSAGVEVRVQPGSRRFPRGFTLTQSFQGNDYVVDLWMPLDRDGVCHVPGALAGTTFQIGRFSGKPIVIEEWDGQPFELP